MTKILLCFLWFIFIPILLGMNITHFMKKEKNNLFYSILIGYFTEFAIFQLFTIPFTYLNKSFNSLYNVCIEIIFLLCIISIIINRNEFKNVFVDIKNNIKNTPKLLTLACFIIIFIQCFVVFKYMHIDEDDSNFVAKATISLQTNTLYVYSDTGTVNSTFPVRYVFSPFPVYTAAVAKFTDYHPTAIAHTAFSVMILILIYINFYLLGMKLFNDNKKDALLFLFFVNVIYIFGDITFHSNFRFALVRLWQGKAVLGNLIIPSLIVIYDSFVQGDTKLPYWICLLITMWSACLVSTMGLALAPLMLGGLTIVHCFRILNFNRKSKKGDFTKAILSFVNLGFKSLICCAPNVLYAIMYAIKKGAIK